MAAAIAWAELRGRGRARRRIPCGLPLRRPARCGRQAPEVVVIRIFAAQGLDLQAYLTRSGHGDRTEVRSNDGADGGDVHPIEVEREWVARVGWEWASSGVDGFDLLGASDRIESETLDLDRHPH